MLNVIVLSVVIYLLVCKMSLCECRSAEFRLAECRYAECRGAVFATLFSSYLTNGLNKLQRFLLADLSCQVQCNPIAYWGHLCL